MEIQVGDKYKLDRIGTSGIVYKVIEIDETRFDPVLVESKHDQGWVSPQFLIRDCVPYKDGKYHDQKRKLKL